jgi:anti-sigma-K factor RskA
MRNGDADDQAALAGAYALGVLDGVEMDEAERLMAGNRGFAGEVRGWRERLAPLDATANSVMPSAALWQRIEASVGARQRVAEARRAPASRSWLSGVWEQIEFWRWSALAGAMAALAMIVVTAALIGRWPAQPVTVAVLTVDGGRPGAVVEAFADGTVRLIPLQDIAVPQGRALQVWTLRDRQEGPISVGLMDKAQTLHLDLGKLPAPRMDQLFEITLEPQTGSTRPTGPVLMKGLASNTL